MYEGRGEEKKEVVKEVEEGGDARVWQAARQAAYTSPHHDLQETASKPLPDTAPTSLQCHAPHRDYFPP